MKRMILFSLVIVGHAAFANTNVICYPYGRNGDGKAFNEVFAVPLKGGSQAHKYSKDDYSYEVSVKSNGEPKELTFLELVIIHKQTNLRALAQSTGKVSDQLEVRLYGQGEVGPLANMACIARDI